MSSSTRRFVPVASTLALTASLAAPAARASVCDNATEAWTAADQVIDAVESNRVADATRVAHTLAACTASGPQAALVTRAILEARLAQIDLASRPVRDALAHAPHPPPAARTDAQFNQWVQRTVAPFVQTANTRIEHDVASAVTSLTQDAGDNASISADAISALAGLYINFGTALRDIPPPPSIARNADLLAAYRAALTENTQVLFDRGATAYNQVHTLALHNHLEPRGVRRAAAWLEIHGIPTANVAATEPAPTAAAQPAATAPPPAAASHPWLGLDFGPAHAVEVLEPVAMALAPLMTRMATCYAPVASASPPPTGRLTVRVVITPAGTAQPAEITNADPSLSAIQACVRDTMSTIRFGTSTNGSLVVQTFEFRP